MKERNDTKKEGDGTFGLQELGPKDDHKRIVHFSEDVLSLIGHKRKE